MIDFGLDKKLLPRKSPNGIRHPIKRRISLRAIKVGNALVVGIVNQTIEILLAQGALDMAAVAAGAKSEPAQSNARVAKCDLIGGGFFNRRIPAQQLSLCQ